MAIILVSYDLKQPGRDYEPVWDYLKKFNHCKGLESVWLLDTGVSPATIRDKLRQLIDSNDVVLAIRVARDWATSRFSCGEWLNDPARNW
jgi:hypothetical protein